ncbi:hypothetical protein [Nesterenkonia sp. CF4.4]|uniref:hypothetical protein n=1 Tax=Nesterenkonia sp. CF4.4 TaxID=3373079 RepID=UPI003EE51E4F
MERPENPTERWLAMSELRRHILSAQVTVALNEQLGRPSPGTVREPAEMKAPTSATWHMLSTGQSFLGCRR